LQLWLLLEETDIPLVALGDSPPSIPAVTVPSTGLWVMVNAATLNNSGLWTTKDIPPGIYKVTVTAVAGTGAVTVLESHAC
jgi:hypothetical protein